MSLKASYSGFNLIRPHSSYDSIERHTALSEAIQRDSEVIDVVIREQYQHRTTTDEIGNKHLSLTSLSVAYTYLPVLNTVNLLL